MKKLITSITAASLLVALSGCTSSANNTTPSMTQATNVDVMSLDVAKVCDVKVNGLENVLALAVKYNPVAKKQGLEFKRLGMKNSQYIAALEKALKDGSKEITLLDKKGKPTKNKMSVEDATVRACKFAISALQQAKDAETTWRLAVPGDGYKY